MHCGLQSGPITVMLCSRHSREPFQNAGHGRVDGDVAGSSNRLVPDELDVFQEKLDLQS